jgi:hypothetical protein
MSKQHPKTGALAIMRKEKQRRALELRKFGLTYVQIGAELGVSPASAFGYVKDAMAEIPIEDATLLRAVQMQRLSAMLTALWPKIQSGDEKTVSVGLAVMQHMDRLTGTEANQSVNVNVGGAVLHIGTDSAQYIDGLKRMAGVVTESEFRELKSGGDVVDVSSKVIPADTADDEIRD